MCSLMKDRARLSQGWAQIISKLFRRHRSSRMVFRVSSSSGCTGTKSPEDTSQLCVCVCMLRCVCTAYTKCRGRQRTLWAHQGLPKDSLFECLSARVKQEASRDNASCSPSYGGGGIESAGGQGWGLCWVGGSSHIDVLAPIMMTAAGIYLLDA